MPAPMLGPLQPTVYRFKLGGFEVATILDSKAVRDGLHPTYGANVAAEEVRALARVNNLDPQRFEHNNIPVIVNTGRELVLFDTGNGTLPNEYEQLKARMPLGNTAARLSELGYKPEDVDVVVITHGHPDHIGGLVAAGQPVFPNARYVFGAAEYDFWQRNENVREARKFNRELFVKICTPLSNRSTYIKPGDQVVPGITAVEAFGHSPGHLAFMLESEGKKLLNWADTAGQFVMSLQRPDLHVDFDDDKERAAATRNRIFDMAATERLPVCGYHMPFPGLGYVERSGTAYRWVPHSYQLNL